MDRAKIVETRDLRPLNLSPGAIMNSSVVLGVKSTDLHRFVADEDDAKSVRPPRCSIVTCLHAKLSGGVSTAKAEAYRSYASYPHSRSDRRGAAFCRPIFHFRDFSLKSLDLRNRELCSIPMANCFFNPSARSCSNSCQE